MKFLFGLGKNGAAGIIPKSTPVKVSRQNNERFSRSFYQLFGKQLSHILKGLKFQSVAARIFKEHRVLFARQSLESDVRLDDEMKTFLLKRKSVPFYTLLLRPVL